MRLTEVLFVSVTTGVVVAGGLAGGLDNGVLPDCWWGLVAVLTVRLARRLCLSD